MTLNHIKHLFTVLNLIAKYAYIKMAYTKLCIYTSIDYAIQEITENLRS